MKKFIYVLLLLSLMFTLFSPNTQAEQSSGETPSNIPISELDYFILNYANKYIGKTTPGASIVVVKDNNIVHAEGYGFTSLEMDTPVDASTTVFEWGSISKLFVWVSALQLVEQGKLDLTSPISNYLSKDEMPKLQYDEPITMLHLMNHTAGFEEYFINLILDSKKSVVPLATTLKNDQPYQSYRPGEKVSYSNYSTSLAAYIIEKITNQSYEDYVKRNIFTPLAMNDTIVTITNDADLEKIKNKRATGYYSIKDGEFTETGFSYLSLYPSGSINGPATDLAKFAQALLAKTDEDNLLFGQLETLDLLYSTTHSASELTPGVAHGFWEYQGTFKSYAHGGNTMGFSTNFHVVPAANFAAVILTNQVAEVAISYGLMDALLSDKAISYTTLPLNKQLDYNTSFITTRKTDHLFAKIYFYLMPLTLSPDYDSNLLTVNINGLSGQYEQIGDNDFRYVSGPPTFLAMKNIHLETEGSKVTHIYAPFSGYDSTNISMTLTMISVGILLLLFIYMIVMSIIYLVKDKRSDHPLKAYALTNLLQVFIFANTIVLFIRIIMNTYRTSDELLIHAYLSYSLGVLTIFALVYMTYQAIRTKTWLKFHFFATTASVIVFQIIFIFWRFYSF